ncbi:unnamed protein product [Paramecium primaurelia]|uniref:Uncharacterized protein n=1 Tax=Paramecium primaurelia TaxID=5886 RepID=A0A8S1JU44_PARPR|nr:unnamed protein product [Paramecium primaurelia]
MKICMLNLENYQVLINKVELIVQLYILVPMMMQFKFQYLEQIKKKFIKAAWLDDSIMGISKGLQYYSAEYSKLSQYIFQLLMIDSIINHKKRSFFCLIYTFRIELQTLFYFQKAIADLLKGLQVYKSVIDGENGMKFFNKFTQIDQQFLQLRDIITYIPLLE